MTGRKVVPQKLMEEFAADKEKPQSSEMRELVSEFRGSEE